MINKWHAAGYGVMVMWAAFLFGMHQGRDSGSSDVAVRRLLTPSCQVDYDRVLHNLEQQRVKE